MLQIAVVGRGSGVGMMTTGPGIPERAPRRVLRIGLGILWILDAVLQAQPAMFQKAVLVDQIWRPVAQGEPGWLAAMVDWSIGIAAPRLAAFNWTIVAVQLAIGATLLLGGRLARTGAWASMAFGLIVWIFGEGLGQLLAGGASLLAGAPGSVCVYVLGSVILLLPVGAGVTLRGRRIAPATLAVAAILVAGGLLQLAPSFWSGGTLASSFSDMASMPQPAALRTALGLMAAVAATGPAAMNAVMVVALIALGTGLLVDPGSPAVFAGSLALLLVIWLVGQDMGALFSGSATDPNTAPALAVLLLAHWAGQPHARRAQGKQRIGKAAL